MRRACVEYRNAPNQTNRMGGFLSGRLLYGFWGKKEIEERHSGCFAVDALCKAPNPPQSGVVHASGSPGLDFAVASQLIPAAFGRWRLYRAKSDT